MIVVQFHLSVHVRRGVGVLTVYVTCVTASARLRDRSCKSLVGFIFFSICEISR